jgi:hypothetical protein
MGQGIESRYERLHAWWKPHLVCAREFLNTHVPQSQSVCILGAGRLLDVDLSVLLERCQVIHLYDADPSCVSVWQKAAGGMYGTRVIGHLLECTDVMERWTKEFSVAYTRGTTVDFLHSCRAPLPSWSEGGFDGVISLNLLGQIPLYWRDRVLDVSAELSHEESSALLASMASLQLAHVEGVLTQQKAWSILITDTEYYFYQTDVSEWRVESALFPGVSEVLCSRYDMSNTHSAWLWHLAPQYVECDEEGEIHRVEAWYRPKGVS